MFALSLNRYICLGAEDAPSRGEPFYGSALLSGALAGAKLRRVYPVERAIPSVVLSRPGAVPFVLARARYHSTSYEM